MPPWPKETKRQRSCSFHIKYEVLVPRHDLPHQRIKSVVEPLVWVVQTGDALTGPLEAGRVTAEAIGNREDQHDESALVVGPFRVGLVVSAMITFVMKAGVVYFFIVRPFAKLAEKLAAASAPPPDVQLLAEIRDLLKSR